MNLFFLSGSPFECAHRKYGIRPLPRRYWRGAVKRRSNLLVVRAELLALLGGSRTTARKSSAKHQNDQSWSGFPLPPCEVRLVQHEQSPNVRRRCIGPDAACFTPLTCGNVSSAEVSCERSLPYPIRHWLSATFPPIISPALLVPGDPLEDGCAADKHSRSNVTEVLHAGVHPGESHRGDEQGPARLGDEPLCRASGREDGNAAVSLLCPDCACARSMRE